MRGLLPADLLARLGVVTDRMLDALSEEQKQRSGGQGSIFAMEHQDPVFSELIACRRRCTRCMRSAFPGRATGAVS